MQGRRPLGQVLHPDRQVPIHPVPLQRGRALASAQPVLHLIAHPRQRSERSAWKQRRLARRRPRRKARQRARVRRLLEMLSQAVGPPPPPARRRPQKAVGPPLLAPRARRHRRKGALRRLRHLHGPRLLLKVLPQRRALQRAPTHHLQLLRRQPQARQPRRAMPQQRPAQFLRSRQRQRQQGLRRARHPQRQPRRFSQAPVLLHRRRRRQPQGLPKQLLRARRRRTPRRRMRRARQG